MPGHGIACPVLAVVFMATGGKPYYLAAMFPVLLAAGAQPGVNRIASTHAGLRRGLLAAALVLSAAEFPVSLPIVPASAVHDTPIVALNYDAGETIGWPAFVQEIARAYDSLPATQRSSAIVLASNYGGRAR